MPQVPAVTKTVSALYQAADLSEVLGLAEAMCMPGRVWCLTWPRVADRQRLVTPYGNEPVDLLIACQVEKVPLRGPDDHGGGLKGMTSLLAGQFPWVSDTGGVDLALHGDTPIALVGITGADAAEDLSKELARVIEHLARLESALQQGALYRALLAHCGEALLAIDQTGRILAGTELGRRLFRIAVYGSPRSPFTSPEDALPAHLLSPLLGGHPASSNKVTMNPAPFRQIGNWSLIEPLTLLSLRSIEPTGSAIPPEKLVTLTPTQKEVFQLLVVGDRNKQIAARLGMSVYTARNHVSNILRALGCGDRLELIARFRRFNPPTVETHEKREMPPLPTLPYVDDIPLPVSRKRS